jgi:hypothetical protein|tara:strand:- start:96 stop:278 length:183 start_codon:yes stop_codon:yes gene_type:complete
MGAVGVLSPSFDCSRFHVLIHFAENLIPIAFGANLALGVEDDGVEVLTHAPFIESFSNMI